MALSIFIVTLVDAQGWMGVAGEGCIAALASLIRLRGARLSKSCRQELIAHRLLSLSTPFV